MATDDFIEPEIGSFSWTNEGANSVPMAGHQACMLINDALDFARGVETVTDILMSHELRRADNPLLDVNQWEGLVLITRMTGRLLNEKWSDQALRMANAGNKAEA